MKETASLPLPRPREEGAAVASSASTPASGLQPPAASVRPQGLPSEVRFHFSPQLERGLLFSEPGASGVLTAIDGSTSDPALTQRLLILTDLPPLDAGAPDHVRRSGLEAMLRSLGEFGIDHAQQQVRWIARSSVAPSTAFVQLHPATQLMRRVVDLAQSIRRQHFRVWTWEKSEMCRWRRLPSGDGRLPPLLLCDKYFTRVDDQAECNSDRCNFSHRMEDFIRVQQRAADFDTAAAAQAHANGGQQRAAAAASASPNSLPPIAAVVPHKLPPEGRFHFSAPLQRGLVFSESGASSGLTVIDGATSDPALTQRLLIVGLLPPLDANATDQARRLELEAMMRSLQRFDIAAQQVRWIARSAVAPFIAFVQLHPNVTGVRSILCTAKTLRHPPFLLRHWQKCEVQLWGKLVGSPQLCDKYFVSVDDRAGCDGRQCKCSHRMADFIDVQRKAAGRSAAATAKAMADSQRREAERHRLSHSRSRSKSQQRRVGDGDSRRSSEGDRNSSNRKLSSCTDGSHHRRGFRSPQHERSRSRSRSRHRSRSSDRNGSSPRRFSSRHRSSSRDWSRRHRRSPSPRHRARRAKGSRSSSRSSSRGRSFSRSRSPSHAHQQLPSNQVAPFNRPSERPSVELLSPPLLQSPALSSNIGADPASLASLESSFYPQGSVMCGSNFELGSMVDRPPTQHISSEDLFAFTLLLELESIVQLSEGGEMNEAQRREDARDVVKYTRSRP